MKTLIGGPKLDHLLVLLDIAAKQIGYFVEFGVYHGGTLKIIAEKYPNRLCYGFDTWEGLPGEAWTEGEPHGIGDFGDCDYEKVKRGMPPNVILKRGVFPDTAKGIEGPVAFAHVDFDYEVSTEAAIRWLRTRMAKGGIVVFDDYKWPHCPGVETAILKSRIKVRPSTKYQCYWVNE